MNETILDQTVRMLLKERLERAERARVVRTAVDHRALQRKDRAKASRTTCQTTEQAAY